MKHSIYLSLLFLFYLQSQQPLRAQALFIDTEKITLTEGSQLFIEGRLQTSNEASIVSENETALTTLQIGNQLISQIIPFVTADGEQIPLTLETQEVTDNSRITAATYPTDFENQPLPSTVTDLTFNNEDIALETLNRFWIITLSELSTTTTFSFTAADLTGNEANEEKLQLIFHNGEQWVHIDSGSSNGVGSNSYTAEINQSGVYALFAGDINLCLAGDLDEDGICDDVDDCIGEAIVSTLEQTICEGENFEGFTESGTFTDTFTAPNGCDSTRTLQLTVIPKIRTDINATICEGEEFEGFTEAGIFVDTFVSASGCDSVRTLQLEVVAEIRNEIQVIICEGEEFEGFTEAGTFEEVFTSAGGCDSVRVLQLEVIPEIRTDIGAKICQGSDFEGFTESGTFIETFTASNGCDSTRTLQLEVLPNSFSEVSATICTGESFEGFTEAGTFETTLVSSNGCDSTRTVVLEVVPLIELADTTITDDTGGGTGAIEVLLNGVWGDFTFEWSNGAEGASINGLEFGTYSVTITDTFGCTVEFEFEVELNTSIEDSEFLPLLIHPNPTQSSIWVQLPPEFQNHSDISLQLMNLQGQLVRTWQVAYTTQQELSLLELNPGIYLLQIQEESSVYFAKIVKL